MKPGITIAIPVYNRAEVVGATLASVLSQTYRPLNVVLVDNNSTDGTRGVLEAWKSANEAEDFRVDVLSEPVAGASAARNAALRVAETEWLMYFDSDDIMLPRHVEKAMAVAEAHPEADVVGWEQLFIYPDRTVCVGFYARDMWFYTICEDNFQTQRYMARTEVFRRVGGWNESLAVSEDMELGIRLLRMGVRAAAVPGPSQVRTILSEGSLTRADSVLTFRRSADAWRQIMPLVPRNMRRWADFHKVYQWAAMGTVNLSRVDLKPEDWTAGGAVWRAVLKLMYHYTARGGRGAMRLFLLLARRGKRPETGIGRAER